MVLLPSPLPATVDQARLDAIVHHVCAYIEDPSKLGATKLNKILWYSDVYSFIRTGETITHATYIKQKFGPVPRDIMASRNRLVSQGKIIEREAPFYGYAQTQFIALVKPDISMFSPDNIAIVDGVSSSISDDHSATSISNATHDEVWKCAEIGEEIPIWAILGSGLEEASQEDLVWVEINKVALLGQVVHS